ncbi:siphovirus Gp157 family protein [Bacillus thuringiensis]|uniref:siphovirus Gp157 family protein n=1 Tax=Bacillus thuringiensis TaxID=1428 RepID=UPI0026E2C46B|nr:siphovirus Gp157 family protein [Bacillus thuringiensis]MDO6634114.1 siphovirus Gp157 family protein [Bacillus thuringiensis]MDO6663549.1 siphovirus Gp157 family protein [Bacillus thuringiensis]MDO6704278.1 siphovirus Gp157 family protein [Bacillus thuringiensis]
MKLYELTSNFNQLQQMIEDGADPAAIQDTLQAIEEAFDEKVQGAALLVRNIDAQAEAIKVEEKRLADRRKAFENNVKGIKEYLYQQMVAVDKRRIKGTLATVGIQKNPASLNIASDAVIPPEFMIPQEPKIDKKALLAAIKDGMQWDGITLKQGESVRIR